MYIYKRQVEVLHPRTGGGPVTYVDVAFSTAELQPGDYVFSIYESEDKGPQLVLHEHYDGVVLRSLAVARLCRAGTMDQWRSWLELDKADDPRAWADQRCWGAELQLSNAHEVEESLRMARSEPDLVLLKDVKIKVVYNEAALVEVLRNSSGIRDGEVLEGGWYCRESPSSSAPEVEQCPARPHLVHGKSISVPRRIAGRLIRELRQCWPLYGGR